MTDSALARLRAIPGCMRDIKRHHKAVDLANDCPDCAALLIAGIIREAVGALPLLLAGFDMDSIMPTEEHTRLDRWLVPKKILLAALLGGTP